MTDRLTYAQSFAKGGFGIFPVWGAPGGVCRCPRGKDCESPGKHPITRDGFKSATTDAAKIAAFMAAKSEPNYGMVPPEHVIALDVDGEGIERLAALEREYGPLPETMQTITANGRHVLLRLNGADPGGNLHGFVTRRRGSGYIIGPGSVHPTGKVYEWNGTSRIAPLPEAWVPQKPEAGKLELFHAGYELPEPGYTGERYGAIRDYIASRYMRGLGFEEMWAGVRDVLAPRFAAPLTESELRSRFERAWKGTPGRLGPPLPEPTVTSNSAAHVGIDAADLLALDLPPLRMIVPGLLPEGTSIIAAHPKVGKSCLVYQIAVEVSLGGSLFGERVEPGSVLYLALEDGMRRGQDRLRASLAGRTLPRGRLEVRWSAPRIGEGLEQELAAWLDEHPDAAFVAVDTLGRVKPRGSGQRNAYDVDVELVGRLQDIFRDRPVAFVLVHHLNKGTSTDFVTQLSGTYGISGSADTIIHVARKRNEQFGTISITGRDIADGRLSVRFDAMTWSSAPAALSEGTFKRTEVYRTIEQVGPAFAKAIADRLGMERTAVQHLCAALVDEGACVRTAKGYAAVTHQPLLSSIPSHSSHSQSEESEGGVRESADLRPEAQSTFGEML